MHRFYVLANNRGTRLYLNISLGFRRAHGVGFMMAPCNLLGKWTVIKIHIRMHLSTLHTENL